MKTDHGANTVTHPEGQGQYPASQPVSVETIPASLSWTKAESASLMERVVDPVNMEGAYRKVVANKGAPGVDSMTVHQLAGHLKQYWPMRITPARSEQPRSLSPRVGRGSSVFPRLPTA